jgi:hypothetical protein
MRRFPFPTQDPLSSIISLIDLHGEAATIISIQQSTHISKRIDSALMLGGVSQLTPFYCRQRPYSQSQQLISILCELGSLCVSRSTSPKRCGAAGDALASAIHAVCERGESGAATRRVTSATWRDRSPDWLVWGHRRRRGYRCGGDPPIVPANKPGVSSIERSGHKPSSEILQ